MASSTENVKLGVCSVLFDGADLGFTQGGVEVEVSTTTHEVKIDQFGETVIGELITGRNVMATVPLAETTLENLLAIMPGSILISDGVKATGTVTFSTSAPANNDAVTIGGVTFTFKTTPLGLFDLPIPATFTAAATEFAAAVNAAPTGFLAVAAAGVVTLTARQRGANDNIAITKTGGANIAVVGATGGVNPTKAKVVVQIGTNINLLTIAKPLVLRPRGSTGEDDFKIYRAATGGALTFSYNFDQERIYSTVFKGYGQNNGDLFEIGRSDAA